MRCKQPECEDQHKPPEVLYYESTNALHLVLLAIEGVYDTHPQHDRGDDLGCSRCARIQAEAEKHEVRLAGPYRRRHRGIVRAQCRYVATLHFSFAPTLIPTSTMLKLHVSSVVLGAVLATGAFLLMSQAGPGVPYGSWGPPKSGVVNVYQASVGPVAPGGNISVFSVQPDRWLTVTGVAGHPNVVIAELFAGNITVKGRAFPLGESNPVSNLDPSFATGSPVGWVFRSGSQVVLQNAGPAVIQSFTYSLMGYQTRD